MTDMACTISLVGFPFRRRPTLPTSLAKEQTPKNDVVKNAPESTHDVAMDITDRDKELLPLLDIEDGINLLVRVSTEQDRDEVTRSEGYQQPHAITAIFISPSNLK
jgi:hypothetical protein